MSAEEERRHWWVRTRFLYLARCFDAVAGPARVLEVGSGTGQNLWFIRNHQGLSRKVASLIGVEPALEEEPRRESWMMPEDVVYRSIIDVREPQDVLIAMDVLEHIDDDVEALTRWAKLLKPGGRGFVSVPALQALWSHHDELLEHKRRYSTTSLRRLVEAAGLKATSVRYAFAAVTPLVFLARKMFVRRDVTRDQTDLRPVGAVLNNVLYVLGLTEAALGGNRLFGTSALAYFVKPKAAR